MSVGERTSSGSETFGSASTKFTVSERAGFIGWTRIRDHQHYLSDVIFGSALGIAAGKTVTIGHKAGRFSVMPVAVPGGGGVFVVMQNATFGMQK